MKKIVLAALCACGYATAVGSLWGPNTDEFPSLQVLVPEAVTCWAGNPEPVQGNPCYETGGWWFGYEDKGGTVQVKKGTFTDFGDGVSLTDAEGVSLIGAALEIKFTTSAAASTSAPSIAGIGFNLRGNETGENIASKGGYCLTYALSGTALQFELGWDEDTYNYDTWYAPLTTGAKKTLQLPWSAFDKDGWGGNENPQYEQPITTATQGAVSAKIRLKNGSVSAGANADFTLYELGWNSECTGGTPVIFNGVTNASLNLSLSGKMLSMTVKEAVPVQIVNLQGAIVHSQVYAPAGKMNLSNLPTGVYMVRVPSLGYSGKIMLK